VERVFHHSAFEVYGDLLLGLRALVPHVIARDWAAVAPRFVELDREGHARASRPYPLGADEAARTRARLAAFGVDLALPAVIADGAWRFFLRSIGRLEAIRALGGPHDLLRDDFLRAAHELAPAPYVPPRDVRWRRPSDFVRDAILIAQTTGDDLGIGDAINDTPEARAFAAQHPQAFSFWQIHRQLQPDEDPDQPAPLEHPAAIWSAAAIALAERFADVPCGSDGPATFQPLELACGPQIHPALRAASEACARRGHLVIGFVEARP
jgi:hypothetical protein